MAYRVLDARRSLALTNELRRSSAWWNDIPNVWVVCTGETTDALYQRCTAHLDLSEQGGDFIWVRSLAQHQPQRGWLPRPAWDWLRTHHL